MEIETLLRDAAAAADAGDFFDDPRHAATVTDAIVLHLVRSIPMLIMSDETWRESHAAHIDRWMRQGREALFWLHRARFGWTPDSDDCLRAMTEDLIAPLAAQMDKGIYFRITVVERFRRYRRMLAGQPVELRRSSDGELLIGDVPVLALREGHPGTGPMDGLGLANCDELVLPLGPKDLAVLGGAQGYTMMPQHDVDRLNAAQVRSAADHLYLRPGSGLESFARSSATADRPNRIPAHLRQGGIPSTFARRP